jgi:hypothetical protein
MASKPAPMLCFLRQATISCGSAPELSEWADKMLSNAETVTTIFFQKHYP